jgi:lipopolysaccharide biosynthesis glycosyltransferase
LRLLIPEVIPERYRRVLYLDSDLVVSDDVSKLWDLPDEGKAFWAAYDEGVRSTTYVREILNFADVPPDAPYFNSGVLLIDLPRWKGARISERAQAILAEHSDRCINVDQDALNIVGVGKWSVLPPRWNFQIAGSQSWSAPPARGETIGITHFINDKPWNPDKLCLYQGTFDRALRASRWYTTLEFLRHQLRKRSTAVKSWLRTTPALSLMRRVRRRVVRAARRLLAGAPST